MAGFEGRGAAAGSGVPGWEVPAAPKPLVLTRHASVRMAERGIRAAWVETVVREPLWVEPEPGDPTAERRFAPVDAFGGRLLRVVCVETGEAIRVITVTFDRGARRPT